MSGTIRVRPWIAALCVGTAMVAAAPLAALEPTPSYRAALAEAVGDSPALRAFYEARNHAPLWTAPDAAELRRAFLAALAQAPAHGLPASRYDLAGINAALAAMQSDRDLGALEVRMSRAYLQWARDISSGVLTPSDIDSGIVREIRRPDPQALLQGLERDPLTFLRSLAPQSTEYSALLHEKLRLEHHVMGHGWGAPVPQDATLRPGDSGGAVIALRDRLMAMGYLPRSASPIYDAALTDAVIAFQAAHGLAEDGVAGPATLSQVNQSPEERLQSVIVAMERERWLGDRGARHVWVNIADFTTQIVENGRVTFSTRSVVGRDVAVQRTPEFSDTMTYMVINPSWSIPRSIIGREYLPALQANPHSVAHLQVVDSQGRVVPRDAVDWRQFTPRNFPFHMRQAPGPENALGSVKFMFPNKYAIYLHDTPQKSLFGRDLRAFSNGCIRLADPHAFAFALLEGQEADPQGFFQRILSTGRETNVTLQRPITIHLDYRTAFANPRGEVVYRRDVYGRDARIFEALTGAGVVLGGVQG
ncbi:L,D-transpeptidase family protein [Halodurantibacterium flavum]|uniref:Murein L,D-transpeptidase n=1 Tax=Halodurantibacterium flavum TaxID=1382802 RepID=A0ABW4S7Z7_9RHOB